MTTVGKCEWCLNLGLSSQLCACLTLELVGSIMLLHRVWCKLGAATWSGHGYGLTMAGSVDGSNPPVYVVCALLGSRRFLCWMALVTGLD